ncbi:MAG: ABC transporter permease [Oscillospiraceae bacterium]|nr:ABC transporter permease [Oscillospiraceae bacterium]
MFFKMLKSDLKRKRGLNIILFLFITVAAVLVFTGSVQIYANFSRERIKEELCKPSDLLLLGLVSYMPEEEQLERLSPVLDADPNVQDWSRETMLRIYSQTIDFPDFDESERSPYYGQSYLCPMPQAHDLPYDMNDEPFYVPNGCIAIPVEVSLRTGVSVGDTVRYTAVTGDVYELTVSTIFKDNLLNSIARCIVSDADFEVLGADSPRAHYMYCIRLYDSSNDALEEILSSVDAAEVPAAVMGDVSSVTDEFVMMEVISIFFVVVSVFIILIILMTIRFTMIADLKEEEREIGMMKALGVDSFRFRWMFAAKYIAFAVVGGVIGIGAGLPLSSMLVDLFGRDCILPEHWKLIVLGVSCVLFIIAVMIGFSLLVMRRIRKISVIEALHGENSGERFTKGSPVFLHHTKHMSVPLFLAISDILSRFKRYLFLLIAYTLGAAILLLVFNVRHSFISPNYTRCWLYHSFDYDLHFSVETRDEIYTVMEHTGKNFYTVVNEQITEAGIPAYVDMMHSGSGYILYDGHEKNYSVYWGEGDAEKLTYHKGGHAPAQENEAAFSAYTAGQLGMAVGDAIELTMYEYNEDRTDSVERTFTVTVTGFYDDMEGGVPSLVLWDGYEAGYVDYDRVTGYVIDAPDKEKPAVIEQLRELYGEECVYTPQEGIRWELSDFDELFFWLEYGVGGAVLLVLMLITYLYVNVFLSEETPEIALLKSMGFTHGSIRKWQLLRMLLLEIGALVPGEVLHWTCGPYFAGLVMQQYQVTGIGLDFEFPVSFLVIPAILVAAVLFVTALTLLKIRSIDIRRITEE